jgi:hypothetical protein
VVFPGTGNMKMRTGKEFNIKGYGIYNMVYICRKKGELYIHRSIL